MLSRCGVLLEGWQKKFIEAWAYQVAQEPRMAALLEEGAVKLITKAETMLKDASAEAQRQPFTLVHEPAAPPLKLCFHPSACEP